MIDSSFSAGESMYITYIVRAIVYVCSMLVWFRGATANQLRHHGNRYGLVTPWALAYLLKKKKRKDRKLKSNMYKVCNWRVRRLGWELQSMYSTVVCKLLVRDTYPWAPFTSPLSLPPFFSNGKNEFSGFIYLFIHFFFFSERWKKEQLRLPRRVDFATVPREGAHYSRKTRFGW